MVCLSIFMRFVKSAKAEFVPDYETTHDFNQIEHWSLAGEVKQNNDPHQHSIFKVDVWSREIGDGQNLMARQRPLQDGSSCGMFPVVNHEWSTGGTVINRRQGHGAVKAY